MEGRDVGRAKSTGCMSQDKVLGFHCVYDGKLQLRTVTLFDLNYLKLFLDAV